jgi:hypothetical protein
MTPEDIETKFLQLAGSRPGLEPEKLLALTRDLHRLPSVDVLQRTLAGR